MFPSHDLRRNGDADNAIEIAMTAAGNFECRLQDSTGADAVNLGPSGSTVTRNKWHHLVFVWDGQKTLNSNAETAQVWLDGAKVAQDTGDKFIAAQLGTSFAIGSNIAGTQHSFCTFDDVLLRKDSLNASQIASIYNQGRGIGARRNRWSSLILVDTGFAPI